jgi:hypothetical protein
MKTAELAIRIRPENPNHHLWNNNGTWWCHYTLHLPDFTKRRVRASLNTCSPSQARTRRDALLASSAGRTLCRIVGEEIGPDGKKMLLLEPITDPQEQQAAHARYKDVTARLMRRAQS